MTKFSRSSGLKLSQCDPRLQKIFNKVLETIDLTVVTGFRDEDTQNEMKRTGKSQIGWPFGKHNVYPSMAIDATPYPIDWKDRERMTLFAGFVLGTAKEMGVTLKWGGDWDVDYKVKDNSFDDLLHFEIVGD